MSCEVADVSAVAAPPQWCGGAVHAAYDTCVSNAIQLASHPLHEAMELGSALWSLTAEASAWQMCLLSVLAVVTVRQYFRWVMWTGLAAAFLAGQLIFVAWQMAMIALSVLCVSLLNIASKVWYVLESTSRWYRGGSISRRVALRRTLQAACPPVEQPRCRLFTPRGGSRRPVLGWSGRRRRASSTRSTARTRGAQSRRRIATGSAQRRRSSRARESQTTCRRWCRLLLTNGERWKRIR